MNCVPWVEVNRPDGVVDVTDTLIMLPGVQDTKAKETDEAAGKLLEVPPIELVLDLKALTTSQ